MSALPDPDALLDGIIRAQRNKRSPKSPTARLVLTPSRVDLRQRRYPVLPNISNSSDDVEPNSDSDIMHEEVTDQPSMSPPVQQQQQNFQPVSMATGTNFASMPGHIAVLPVMFPWQQPSQVPYHTPFEARHNAMWVGHDQNAHAKKAKKREPWYKKFNYRPMSENRAAVVIQRCFRGYLTRRNLEFQQFLSNRWLAATLVDRIIDDVLRSDLVPDILIELLQERMRHGGWFENDPEHRAHQIVCSRLIDEVVRDLVPVFVKEANHELVLGYLQEHGIHREPLVHVVKRLVDEVIEGLVKEEVEMFITDTLQGHLNESRATLLTDQLLVDTIDEEYLTTLVLEVVAEHHCEVVYNECIDGEVLIVIRECLLAEWADGSWSQGSAFITPVIDQLTLDLLLRHIASQGSLLDIQHSSDNIMSEMMLRVTIQQMMEIHERVETTRGSIILRHTHQQYFQEMAFDVLLAAWRDLWN
ncbi:uncharacterized protein [Dysidea avara]|uniref:uncharacterized protein isoform X2 n=1 Tax=Dysidea avara TaxID=196820 RepID=UPI00331A52F4